jgi:hypothetical protein
MMVTIPLAEDVDARGAIEPRSRPNDNEPIKRYYEAWEFARSNMARSQER